MGKKVIAGIVAVSAVLILVFLKGIPVMAGSLNAEESALVSAASGTFSFAGGTYKAYPDYIQELKDYLMRDDVDLTAEQASNAMSTMYGSVEQGVISGYLYLVSGTPVSSDASRADKAKKALKDGSTASQSERASREEIKKQIESGGLFSSSGDGKVQTSPMIKDTGYNITKSEIVFGGLLFIMAAVVVAAFRLRLFTPDHEE